LFRSAIGETGALTQNINPGGGIMHRPLNWGHMKRIPADLRNRLLSKKEVDTRLDVLGDAR